MAFGDKSVRGEGRPPSSVGLLKGVLLIGADVCGSSRSGVPHADNLSLDPLRLLYDRQCGVEHLAQIFRQQRRTVLFLGCSLLRDEDGKVFYPLEGNAVSRRA